jgi:hypothetical protein
MYALTIFLGAFLLFQVQPLIGKYILPWFGGGPGVWTTCMLFFQVVLLGGYAYAHFTSRWLKPRRQVLVHLVLLVAAVALLPIIPADRWKPHGDENPTVYILLLLGACLGLPYLVLSTTGPLIQHWFSRAQPSASPYRLYALSNIGSLLALLSYPFYFENHFTRRHQAMMWAWGLGAYAIACAMCAVRYWKASAQYSGTTVQRSEPAIGSDPTSHPSTPTLQHSSSSALLWFLLPACASILLLATTNKICQDVAVIPFLWILPLAVYLLSFIICFDSPRWYLRVPFTVLLAGALAGLCWTLVKGSDLSIQKQVAIYSGALLICCMVCHGELYRLRPDPSRLTSFYLMIAAGGACGGIFVAVAAPMLFKDYLELQWGMLLCAVLVIIVWAREPVRWVWRIVRRFMGGSASATRSAESPASDAGRLPVVGYSVLPTIFFSFLCLAFIALVAVLWKQVRDPKADRVYSARNFYGVLSIFEYRRDDARDHYFLLQHGRITHGLQFADPDEARWATSYYCEDSGIGLAVAALPKENRRMGLLGLGTATFATYAKAGDYLRIYEINPQVKDVATSRFSYIRQCPGTVEIALGDARLSMEREPPQHFDLLVLDAFSSDAIPVHLLTKESFEIYQRHLNTNAIIAVHISNHYLDLQPVVENLARHFDYKMVTIDFDENEEEWWLYGSTWILLSHDASVIDAPKIQRAANTPKTAAHPPPLWTDDFTSLFQILK